MTRCSLVEFVCIVAIGMAMVEFAAGDRQSHETNASVLAAKLAAVMDADVAATPDKASTNQQIGRQR
jgi:hypothetical protein